MLNKRILILSNNALNKTNSNGRTLLNFFNEEDKEQLAQFFLHNETPDFTVCQRYFCATDGQVVQSFFKRKPAGCEILKKQDGDSQNEQQSCEKSTKGIKRTAFTMLLRNFFWDKKCWRKELDRWVEKFKPECILLQAGDCPFLYKLARIYAQSYQIPLLIYNSEDYYFKRYNYFDCGSKLFYKIFHRKLRKEINKTMPWVKHSVYISEELKELFDGEFDSPSSFIYTATELKNCGTSETDREGFAYLGNLSLGRSKQLIKIANALTNIDTKLRLKVYGKLPSKEEEQAFTSCEGIEYCGFVGYEEVIKVLQNSKFLFHVESFDPFYRRVVRYGFSTKIADSLASGACFIVFAPEEVSCVKYLQKNHCACIIAEEEQIEQRLKEIITERQLYERYILNAQALVRKNHDVHINQKCMAKLINTL